MTRRARALAVVAIVAAGALGVISSTQTWLVVTLAGAAASELPVAGAAAVPVLAPLCLALLALGLALSIVGLVLRYVFGVLTVAAGAVLVALAWRVVIARPVAAVASTVTGATGISGDEAVAQSVSDITATPWPALGLAGSVVLVAAGVFTLITAHRWRRSGRRFRTDAALDQTPAEASGPLDAVDSWDDLSRGDDPTAGGVPR